MLALFNVKIHNVLNMRKLLMKSLEEHMGFIVSSCCLEFQFYYFKIIKTTRDAEIQSNLIKKNEHILIGLWPNVLFHRQIVRKPNEAGH